jgi:hypothetical protein
MFLPRHWLFASALMYVLVLTLPGCGKDPDRKQDECEDSESKVKKKVNSEIDNKIVSGVEEPDTEADLIKHNEQTELMVDETQKLIEKVGALQEEIEALNERLQGMTDMQVLSEEGQELQDSIYIKSEALSEASVELSEKIKSLKENKADLSELNFL